MSTVTIPKDLQLQLQMLKERTELMGEDGKLVGTFLPKAGAPWRADCPYTDEELDEFAKQTTGRPLPDILHELEEKWPSK